MENTQQPTLEPIHSSLSNTKIPLVLIYNGFDSAKTWEQVLPHLPQWVAPMVYDRQGYGTRFSKTQFREPVDLVKEGVEELDQVIEQNLGTSQPILIWGHCIGAAMGLVWAAKHPSRVKALVAEAPGFFSNEELADKSEWLLHKQRKLPEKFVQHFDYMHGEGTAPIIWDRICSHRSSYIINPSYTILPQINNISIPVLILQGTRDIYFDPEHAQVGADVMEQARIEVIHRGSHDLHLDDPLGITSRVSRFFSSVIETDLTPSLLD
jgi:pimeloyl-ACP methyl ester carboxylesterase